jgi:diguanylate cyclase
MKHQPIRFSDISEPASEGLLDRVRGLFALREHMPPHSPANAAAPREHLSDRDRFAMRHGVLLEQICDFLSSAGLDPIPDHYELAWFYLANASFTQRHVIEAHMIEHNGISPADAVHLLDHFRNIMSGVELTNMVERAKDDILAARATADQAGREVSDYSAALDISAFDTTDPEQVAMTIHALQELTQDMVIRTARAEAELSARSKAMGKLKTRLAQSQKQAVTDALTGLPNRRGFDAELSNAVEKAHANAQPLSVGFCDIDHFKRVNDEHGHATGDRVIRHVATCLSSDAGTRCHVARHGGEEFALLFIGLTASQAYQQLDSARLRLNAKNLIARDSGKPLGELSFSGGIATLHNGESASKLLARADHALYEAKNAGRNRILIAD